MARKKKQVLDELEKADWWNPLTTIDPEDGNSHNDMTWKIMDGAARLARDALLEAREVDMLQKSLSFVYQGLTRNDGSGYYRNEKNPAFESAFNTIRSALYEKQNNAWGRFFTFAISTRGELNTKARKIALRKALAFFRDNKDHRHFYPRTAESEIEQSLDVPFLDVALNNRYFSSSEPNDQSLMEDILLEEAERVLMGTDNPCPPPFSDESEDEENRGEDP